MTPIENAIIPINEHGDKLPLRFFLQLVENFSAVGGAGAKIVSDCFKKPDVLMFLYTVFNNNVEIPTKKDFEKED